MYIYCSWNYENGGANVKFADLSETVDTLDFLQDCIGDITAEYNRILKLTFPKAEIKDDTVGDYGNFN